MWRPAIIPRGRMVWGESQMTPSETQALALMRAEAVPGQAARMAARHRVPRLYLGTPNAVLDRLARQWRRELDLPARLDLAAALWRSDVHEGRIVAAKLLTQARIRPDDRGAWGLIVGWVPQLDGRALADHAAAAGQRRLVADPGRIETVARWTDSAHMWTRRAALAMTLPWARLRHPGPVDTAIRERALGWAATHVADPDRFIQTSVAQWLRELSRRDPARVAAFLEAHGDAMRPFARREATRHLP